MTNKLTLVKRVATIGFTLVLLSATPVQAESVTVTWPPGAEPDIAGYTVYWGTQSGVYTASRAVVGGTSLTIPNLRKGVTYYFVVQAYTRAGIRSEYSEEATAAIPGNPLSAQEWMRKFGITDMNADSDGDGLTNQQEFDAETDPTIPNTWHLTGGATGFSSERLAVVNPGTDPSEITVTLFPEGASPVARDFSVPAQSRISVDVQSLSGLSPTSLSGAVTTRRGGVVVERTMFRSGPEGQLYGGHTGKGVLKPLTRWYFAEGDAALFDTHLLFENANASPTTVNVKYLLDDGTTSLGIYTVNPLSRLSVYTNDVAGLRGHSFSTTVSASLPVTTERAMSLGKGSELRKAGADSGGVGAPSTRWYLAEGRTGPFFDEYLTIANPNPVSAAVSLQFFTPSGSPVVRSYNLGAQSRTTVYVDGIPGLEDAEVSASIVATLPVVVERAMYWPGDSTTWYGGHASAAVAQPGTRWVLAEGEVGGPASFVSFIQLWNPSSQAADVQLTLLRENGTPVVSTHTVPPSSRLSVDQFPLEPGEKFGALVESTNAVPIVVERSMYWDAIGLHWSGGTNETGARLADPRREAMEPKSVPTPSAQKSVPTSSAHQPRSDDRSAKHPGLK